MQKLSVSTGSKTQLVDITDRVQDTVTAAGIAAGVCHIFVPHTTAGITLNENWDSDVERDVLMVLDDHIVPRDAGYRHGEGNSPAHIKASLMGSSATVLIEDSRLQLGRWQGIFLAEFDGPRSRTVWVKIMRDK
jgi:secondary thiamine-phosphate synthase enzyme